MCLPRHPVSVEPVRPVRPAFCLSPFPLLSVVQQRAVLMWLLCINGVMKCDGFIVDVLVVLLFVFPLY